MSDKNESTCLNVTRQTITMSLISELHVKIQNENIPDKYVVIKILMNGPRCNTSIVIYKLGGTVPDCKMKKTQGKVGQPFWVVLNMNICYYKTALLNAKLEMILVSLVVFWL